MSDRLRKAVHAYRGALKEEAIALRLVSELGQKIPTLGWDAEQWAKAAEARDAVEQAEVALKACVQARRRQGEEVFAAALAGYPEEYPE